MVCFFFQLGASTYSGTNWLQSVSSHRVIQSLVVLFGLSKVFQSIRSKKSATFHCRIVSRLKNPAYVHVLFTSMKLPVKPCQNAIWDRLRSIVFDSDDYRRSPQPETEVNPVWQQSSGLLTLPANQRWVPSSLQLILLLLVWREWLKILCRERK